jgi:uncharacterized protein (TIGR02588 family)
MSTPQKDPKKTTAKSSRSGAKTSHVAEIPLPEWVVGAVGLVIVVVTLGVLLYETMAGDKTPPDVKLRVQSIATLRNGFLVKVEAENEGGEPAARVPVQGELVQAGKVSETAEVQFEYLPAHSKREAGLFFKQDPRQGEVRLQALGYEVP